MMILMGVPDPAGRVGEVSVSLRGLDAFREGLQIQ